VTRARRPAALLLAVLALLAASPASAHRGQPVRHLRLQIENGELRGLLAYALPPGPETDRLLAVPRGLEDKLAERAAAEALLGVVLRAGRDRASLQPLTVKLVETKARRTQTGGLDAMALLSFGAAPGAGALLELAAGNEPPLRTTLALPAGTSAELLAGLGKPTGEGLELRPRPRRPCLLRLVSSP
jgi:hypothetical protein